MLSIVDQGGSLGVVGWVFEVMAQVDHRLTKVKMLDQIIRVNDPNEDLGRHSDLVPFHQGVSSPDLSIQGSEANH
jgi:hypothetical protein